MKSRFVVSDRYSATGTPRPGKDACRRCEGMGFYPKRFSARWRMVKCEVCKGTRVSSKKRFKRGGIRNVK